MSEDVSLRYDVEIHDDGPEHGLWAKVEQLPGLFASGRDEAELNEALDEAIGLYLSTPESKVTVRRESSAVRHVTTSYEKCLA